MELVQHQTQQSGPTYANIITVLYCTVLCTVLYCTVLTQGMRKTAQMRMTLIWSSTVLVVADMCFVTVIPERVDRYLRWEEKGKCLYVHISVSTHRNS